MTDGLRGSGGRWMREGCGGWRGLGAGCFLGAAGSTFCRMTMDFCCGFAAAGLGCGLGAACFAGCLGACACLDGAGLIGWRATAGWTGRLAMAGFG